ncbi:DUF6057 family protein [Parabacteroides faecis]|uniref:Transmembrane protein n=1 Tax=Parabacteroides faecis TaxID=1217282 RepID=A0ABR6KLC2_9BACT|nr:DUF6057 family protein [Parabacteroides faecis]MBB4622305.1 hypothetical protein [Parabacteroides faecis]
MKKLDIHVPFGLILIITEGCFIVGLLQYRYVFHLFFLEQYQLFLEGKEYAAELLSRPGGFIEYISEYCVQFFHIDFVGCVSIAVILLLIGWLLHCLLKEKREQDIYFLFEGIIVFFLLLNILDIAFFLRGMVGYLFCIACLYVYRQIQNRLFSVRLLWGIGLGCALFWIAAPFQTLFLITAGCLELKEHGFNKGRSLIWPICTGVIVCSVYYWGGNGVCRIYMLPDGICSFQIILGWTKYVSWVLLPVAVLLMPLFNKLVGKIGNIYHIRIIQMSMLMVIFIFVLPKYDDGGSLPYKRLNHYAVNEKWDEILDYCKKYPPEDFRCLNYQNLALAKKGILTDSLFAYNQKGGKGLFAPWDRTVYTAFVLQKVCYYYGNIAFAQKYAFEGNVCSTSRGFPETMKMLVRTNLLQKEYRVAAKYIYYLQQTSFYKDWADRQCRYLSVPDAVEEDPQYAGKRQFLWQKNHFVLSNEFRMLASRNKDDRQLRNFVLCFYLLEKDLAGFLEWFNYYYASSEYEDIPDVYYEALMVCSIDIPEVLDRYRIPDSVKNDFEMYNLIYRSAKDLKERKYRLSLYHADSYWFYFHYVNKQ